MEQSGDDLRSTLLDPQNRRPVAQVFLNGHRIEPGGPLGQSGALRSFVIVAGSVHSYWHQQRTLILSTQDGRESLIRVAALPVEEGEIGFVEFV